MTFFWVFMWTNFQSRVWSKNVGCLFSNTSCNFSRWHILHSASCYVVFQTFRNIHFFSLQALFLYYFYILYPNVFHFSGTLFALTRDGKIGWWHSHYIWCLNGFPFVWETILTFHSPTFPFTEQSLHPLISFCSKTSFCSVFRNAKLH